MRRARSRSAALLFACAASVWIAAPAVAQVPADSLPTDASRPNVLWIYVEDTNDWMSCYGDEVIQTPNIDALAERGTRFTRAYMPAGVCSPTRSAKPICRSTACR